MSTYKGIPFTGGLDSPSGTGAQSIVSTLEAMIDFLMNCVTPGQLTDFTNVPSINWQGRALHSTTAATSLDWENGILYDPASGVPTLQWRGYTMGDPTGHPSLNWNTRQLTDTDGSTVQIEWQDGVHMRNLPTSDPGSQGQLWNDGGTLRVSI